MRKISLIGFVMLIVSIPTFAGGLLTNTNQHVAFLRMLARGASIDIDGVYSNPAGLAFLPGDGLYLSLNGQSAYQTRNIDMTFPLFPEDGHRRYYKGKASAPFIPSFQGAYKKGDWTVSGSFAVGGGGGKASFDDGLGSQTVIERSLSSSTANSEATGYSPVSFFISTLETRNKRSRSFTLIITSVPVFREQWKRHIYITRLISTLSVQRKIKTVARQESQTGRIGINTVNINGSTAC